MKSKYQVIYADPPWSYKAHGSKNYRYGMAQTHYNEMSTEDISALPIKNIKSDNCILFIWATFPNLHEALKVIKAWGFEYKTAAFVWIKKNKRSNTNFWGMGNYTRANAEICLLAVSHKTKAQKQVLVHNISQIIEAPIEVHSKKTDIVRSKIVELLGDVPRIELFARKKVEGWDVWGNEVQSDIIIKYYEEV